MENVSIGNNLKSARKNKGLTLKELSRISGVSISFISDIENYRRTPSLETALKLSSSLEINTELLLNNDTKNIFNETSSLKTGTIQISNIKKRDPLTEELADYIDKLPMDKKLLLKELIKSMSD